MSCRPRAATADRGCHWRSVAYSTHASPTLIATMFHETSTRSIHMPRWNTSPRSRAGTPNGARPALLSAMGMDACAVFHG